MEPWGERSAELYELVFAEDDHEAQVTYVNGVIEDRAPLARSLLDVACGTGRHLELFAHRYPHVEGIDLSPAMLSRARERVPHIPLHQADMRAFEIGRMFDAVTCLSSSIVWMPDADALHEAIGTMARHIRPGGVLVLEPWPEPGQDSDVKAPWTTVVEASGRTIALMETTRLEHMTWIQETHYLIAEGDRIAHEFERTEFPAFRRVDLRAAFDRTGLETTYDPEGPLGRGLWVGLKPDRT